MSKDEQPKATELDEELEYMDKLEAYLKNETTIIPPGKQFSPEEQDFFNFVKANRYSPRLYKHWANIGSLKSTKKPFDNETLYSRLLSSFPGFELDTPVLPTIKEFFKRLNKKKLDEFDDENYTLIITYKSLTTDNKIRMCGHCCSKQALIAIAYDYFSFTTFYSLSKLVADNANWCSICKFTPLFFFQDRDDAFNYKTVAWCGTPSI